MFICDSCLKEAYTNRQSISRSHGQCEICRKVADCNSIPSFALDAKRRPPATAKGE